MGRADRHSGRHRAVSEPPKSPRDATRLIRAGKTPASLSRTVGPPIQKGSTVILPDAASLYDERQVTYGRAGLATQETLMSALCELEGARAVKLYPSGIAALAGAMLAVLKAGDEVLVTDCIYKPTRRFCGRVLTRFGVAVRYFAPDASPEAVMAMATPATRLIVLESPGSLSFEMQDAPAIAALARQRGVLTLMDNTWGAGLLFKPLAHGIDLSVQALTKYMGGHSDVFMGSVAAATPAMAQALERNILDFGWSVAAEDAYQMLRGLRTLPTRLERHGASALKVAAWLQQQPEVARVLYPALPGAPGHELWKRDYTGAAGIFAIVMRNASEAAVAAFLDALTLFGLGFSWGGFESLALNCDPQFDVRETPIAYGGPLVRLNIGLEDPDDLIADLRHALDAMNAIR
jgi:cystathionine beta-lyase